jgi:serine/threonine-protein kinase RsbW
MALDDTGEGADGLKGFVMGHGGLVLKQEDLLEMERFLSQVSKEISSLPAGTRTGLQGFVHEGEFAIPELARIDVVDKILSEAERYFRHENDSFWIRLSLDEAIENAILHGHNEPLEHPTRTVRVRYAISPSKLIFVVEDSGEGFDHEHVPDPTADENLMNVNGRGVFLMRSVMDEVVYNQRGNQVTMVKELDGRPIVVPMRGEDGRWM